MTIMDSLVPVTDAVLCREWLSSAFSHGPLEQVAAAQAAACHMPATVDPVTKMRPATRPRTRVEVEGGYAEQLETDDEIRLALIGEHLGGGRDRFAIFDNAMSRRGDGFLTRARARLAYCGERVLYPLAGPTDEETIELTMREARRAFEWGAILGEDREVAEALRTRSELQPADVEAILRNVQYALAGIADGESFVICQMTTA
jgi:hypothetical protein